jgi:hypothetical protein
MLALALVFASFFGGICAMHAQVNPTITNLTDKGLAAALNWAGGTGVFMLQRKVNITDPAWVNVLTTSNRSMTLAKDAQTGCWRLQSQVTNTVLPFTVMMTGASEVPPVSTPAVAVGSLSLEGSNLNYYVSFSGLTAPANAAHFHAPATPTNSANVMVPLSPPAATEGVMSGSVLLTQSQITNLINGLVYMNIHNSLNPSGEIRGQVVPLSMVAALNAAAEIPTNNSIGTATARLTFIGNQLLYNLTYSGLSANATAAHIHGPAVTTNSADVLVPLNNPSGTSGTISGTATLTPVQMAFLLAGQTYINIHTTANPGGELRGQIWPIQFGVTMNAASEVPPTVSSGASSGRLTIISNLLSYSFTFTNLSAAANAGHIHGPAGPTNNNNVLIPFAVPSATSGSFSGSVTLTPQILFYLINGLTYANIHTGLNPAGEIRGQVIPSN